MRCHCTITSLILTNISLQALESLSSPIPSTQLPRLKALYLDLRDSLSPLFPSQHPVIQSLSFPLPPTSSPLHSALALLKEILTALKQRCAPVRDVDIDVLLVKLDEPLSPPPYVHNASQAHLATLIIDVIRSLVILADILKSDLTQSVLGAMSEAQLAAVISQQARARERELVLEMWGGKAKLSAAWEKWFSPADRANIFENAGEEQDITWKTWVPLKLIKTLALPVPVSCDVPTKSSELVEHPPTRNELPPQFFFTAPALFYLQNFLQALVVAATLGSLTRIPQPPPIPGPRVEEPPGSDFMSRVWTLLKAELDRDEFSIGAGVTGRGREEQEDPTKIVNLADEVIRARRLSSSTITEQEETSLRQAVERTLQPRDPVFLLLLGRVVRGVGDGLIHWPDGASAEGMIVQRSIPEKMRSGRVIANGQSHILHRTVDKEHDKVDTSKPGLKIAVKGFEDPVLAKGIEDLAIKIMQCVQWMHEVWGDLVH